MLRSWIDDKPGGPFTFWSSIHIKLIHQPGLKMIQSDALSWCPDLIPEMDHNNENMMLLLDDLFLSLLDVTLQECILNLGQIDDFLKTFSPTDPPFGSSGDWKLELVCGLNTLFYRNRNYIPDDLTLQQDVLWMLHDHKMAVHLGRAETLVAVEWHYWWSGLHTFVWNYVKDYGICQQYKINRSPAYPFYMPILPSSSTWPFASCSMDLVTDLPPSQGFDSILVMVDHGLTKGVILLPCNNNHCGTCGRITTRTPLQTIWTSRQIYLGQRTPVCCPYLLETTETFECD